jgi:hypothetical protein
MASQRPKVTCICCLAVVGDDYAFQGLCVDCQPCADCSSHDCLGDGSCLATIRRPDAAAKASTVRAAGRSTRAAAPAASNDATAATA